MTLQLAAKVMPAMNKALQAPMVKMVALPRAENMWWAWGRLKDAAGATVGILFSQKEVTPLFSAMWKGIVTNILILIAIVSASLTLPLFLPEERA